ncbi:hypothetical protein [Mastigocoleus testarum]|uniref:Uncharacterized protein n=1 Tax=Mastigocoleus testarum BC008 TaxID=371196 RepID=A0A0V7ZL93_9CYAN|nr:hypothetical protein [Mastigocoleus testarum]KST65256.1 hypothetical protein BC008_20915 [Mastigocoleus testarum BC008]
MDYPKVKVAYPKLTLYAFHLRHNLAQGHKNSLENAAHLWRKCQEIGKILGIPKLENLPLDNKGKISDEDIITFTAIKHENNLHLSGEVNRLEIHDTYALDLTFRCKHPEVETNNLKILNQNNCLLPTNIDASLGQTLVFFAQPVGIIDNYYRYADTCVKALISEDKFKQLELSCQEQGKLLNSPIFEYNNNAVNPREQCHILIWLNINPQTTDLEEAGEYYYPLIDILNCRSKIMYAHSQARWCYQQAITFYSKLEERVNKFNLVKSKPIAEKLKEFEQWLDEIPKTSFNYARYLRDLELHKNTIKTNVKNYKLYLGKMKQIWLEDDLDFLSNFVELAEDTFIEQINTDLAYLTSGQNLFEQLIESIRGIVEIEQTRRDRSLEKTVQIVGIGLGGGAIASGIITQHIDKPFAPTINFKYPVHPIVSSLFWSVLATGVCLLLGWWLTVWRENKASSSKK